MGTQRTSNKDVLDAINALTQAITQSVINAPAPAAPAQVQVAQAPEETNAPVKLDPCYVNHVKVAKAQPYANDKGADVVLYARHNGRGETKLAYCLAEKFAKLRDRGLIGAIAIMNPEA